jgi:hypothetical protein
LKFRAPKPDPGVGLFLRSPAPVLPSSVSNQQNKGWTHLSVAIAFDGSGNVREAHIIKSSGVPAADEVVRNWIQAGWKARPEVAQAGLYKGRPLDSTEFNNERAFSSEAIGVANVGFLVTDRNGKIRYATAKARKLIGKYFHSKSDPWKWCLVGTPRFSP